MPRLTPADSSLILDHVVGDRAVPTVVAKALLSALPFPSHPTPRLRRAILLRRLAADPVSANALDSFHLLASLPTPTPVLAAAHLAVATFLAVSAPDFDAAARALFARPDGRARRAIDEGGSPVLGSDEAIAVANQFEAAIGNPFSKATLKLLFGDRADVEERVRELVDAEWAVVGPSKLEGAAERLVGDNAIETWRAADEVTRAKYTALVGKEKSDEILSKLKLEETSSHASPIATPEVRKLVDAPETSVADLHISVEDALPAAKAAAHKVLASRSDKAFDQSLAGISGHQTTCGTAGPSSSSDINKAPNKGTPSLMDSNPTAHTYQWENSPDLEHPHLSSPRRVLVSHLQAPENKDKRRKSRKWSALEEEALRKGVEQYGTGNWKNILSSNPDVFMDRTTVDLKDKWRNMRRF